MSKLKLSRLLTALNTAIARSNDEANRFAKNTVIAKVSISYLSRLG